MKSTNKLIKTTVILFYCIFLCIGVRSQVASKLATSPIYVPPSPNASSLALFADYPVSYYTGIPEINIPIYEINIDNFKMPINLSYHSSGIRISQEASWVGLGWALNIGGSISRTVRCLDDFVNNGNGSYGALSTGYYYSPDTYNYADYYTNSKLIIDTEPDLFYFNLPNVSGKFILNKSNEPVLFDKSTNVKIKINEVPITTENNFTITTPDGTNYIFEKKEISETSSNNRRLYAGEYDRYDILANNWDDSDYRTYVSTWLLSKIILVNNKEINFIYTPETYTAPGQESCILYSGIPGGLSFPQCTETIPTPGRKYSSSMQIVKSYRLIGITWDMGRIDLSASNREDMIGEFNGLQKLDEINVTNNDGKLIKNFTFGYNYFGNTNNTDSDKDYLYKRLKLIKLNESGIGNYTFSYNEGNLPAKNYTSSDYWGFYNGQNYGDNYFTQALNGTTLLSGALKVSNEAYMKIGSLNKIVFPTGGYTRFIFEMNRFDYSGLKYVLGSINSSEIRSGGGLRISQIITGGNDIVTKRRNFTYFGGKVIKPLCLNYVKTFSSNISCNINSAIDYFVQTSSSMIPLTSFSKGNVVGYDAVEERLKVGNTTSFTNYSFHNNIEDDEEEGYNIFPYHSTAINYYNGLPKEICYGYMKENIKYFTKKTINGYSDESIWLKTINASYVILNERYDLLYGFGNSIQGAWMDSQPIDYNYRFEWIQKLSETSITAKTNGETNLNATNGVVETITFSNYDKQNGKPKTITGAYTQKTVYPQDLPNDYISKKMVEKFMIETPLEMITLNSNRVISGEKITYIYDENSLMYVPSIANVLKTPTDINLTLSNYNNYYEPKLYYDKYDKTGKVLQIRNNSDVIVYLWSYKNQYPIAKIRNATFTEVENAAKSIFSVSSIDALSELSTPNESKLKDGSLQRALPSALINTYTYKHLIGITSMTDPRGSTTYYDYDEFNRLKENYIIENNTKKILKKYYYHHQNQ